MKHLCCWLLVNENAGFWDALISPLPMPHCLQLEVTLSWKGKKLVTVISSLGPAVPCGHYFYLIHDAESIVSFHNKVLNLSLCSRSRHWSCMWQTHYKLASWGIPWRSHLSWIQFQVSNPNKAYPWGSRDQEAEIRSVALGKQIPGKNNCWSVSSGNDMK